MRVRSNIGAALLRDWAIRNLPRGSTILDVGCGSGKPVAAALAEEGFEISGIDASSKLIAAFRQRFPDARTACEPAQDSDFFGMKFDAVICIGLLFLLRENDQKEVIGRVAKALKPRGRFLFTSPRAPLQWADSLTGRLSLSLGAEEYARLLRAQGLTLHDCWCDEGENNYFDAQYR